MGNGKEWEGEKREGEAGGFGVLDTVQVAQGSLFVSPAAPRDERMTVV